MSGTTAKLEIYRGGTSVRAFPLTNTVVTLGRALDNGLHLQGDPTVSDYHGQLSWTANHYVITDLDSGTGTYLNNVKLLPHHPRTLVDGDRLRIGSFELTFCVVQQESPPTSQRFDLKQYQLLRIGRDPSNDLEIAHPVVSKFHAQLRSQQGDYVICDRKSTHGTFVNGQPVVGQQILRVDDVIRIGPCTLTLTRNDTLLTLNESGRLSLDAIHLSYQLNKRLNLLHDISLSIQPGEFVAIAGSAESGRTTLLIALSGLRPATSGTVLVNGTDLYQNFNAYRTEIGYVPQWNTLHRELTVEQTLDFAAQLRLPEDTTRGERKARIAQVLIDLGLTQQRNVPIQALGGDPIQRVAIGLELLTQPTLLFLDQVNAGVAPDVEIRLMRLIRKLADQGCTILMVTHATENMTLCDQVVFMSRKGYWVNFSSPQDVPVLGKFHDAFHPGHLAYFGPPQEAPQYFGVERFHQIYIKVEEERSPEQWQQRYLRSPYYQAYVVNRQQPLQAPQARWGPRQRQQLPGAQMQRRSGWRQCLILSQRNWAMLMGDRPGLLRMLAVAPVLGFVNFLIWRRPLFSIEVGNPRLAILMLFTTIAIAVVAGSLPTGQTIAAEHNIYRHERMKGLQVLPYVVSKFGLGLLWSLYQAAVLLAFTVITVPDLSATPAILVGTSVTMTLATVSGMVLGVFSSAIAPNRSVAPLLVIVFLVPQIIFGGGVLPVDTFGPPGQFLNKLALTKWPFEALVTLSGLGANITNDRCWQGVTEHNQEHTDHNLEPGDLSDARKEKSPCEINQKFSHTFNVNVPRYLMVSSGLIGVLLSLTLLVQKLKDVLYQEDPFRWII